MAQIPALLESGIVIGGDLEENQWVVIPYDEMNVSVKCNFPKVVHTGYKGLVYGDVLPTYWEAVAYPDEPFMPVEAPGEFVTTGKESKIWAGNGSSTVAMGEQSRIIIGIEYSPEDEEEHTINGCKAFALGDSSSASFKNPPGSDNLLITAGIDSYIDLGEATKSVGMVAGDNSTLYARDANDNVAIATGYHCDVNAENTNNTVIITGENSSAAVGEHGIIFASRILESFTIGKGGVASVVWHDGERNRIKVIYEGEEGIEAGRYYKVDENGQVIEI
ncbi:TPA: hypothetical protein RQP16_001459 [Klebsiella michiganensis]|nr:MULTISPECIES: hypothetical protein [Klebsiella]QLX15303.1 hypothetical protein HV230_12525 [Klebsiella oxytoca]AWF50427.1 hypothetical protein CSC12_1052 [Klebsiella michiganensis]EKQ6538133.1 hypothetical protein [Klebsiella michiganensis]ELQ7987181.1 hypothetical protein [Klebsiella michiganensis]MBZ7752001.1 hypothetical protein [Klebsiella michiganensis]